MGSARDKRWAIAPPPSPTSSAISGEMNLEEEAESTRRQKRQRVSRPEASRVSERLDAFSDVKELEPSNSEKETLSPEPPAASEGPANNAEFETIPAPKWFDADE